MTNERKACIDHHVNDLSHNFSTKPSTKRQQEKHFECNCRRICNNAGIDFTSASSDELILASKHKTFLMMKSDWILKLLMHLKYKEKFAYPSQEDYDFPIPYLKQPPAIELTNKELQEWQRFYDERKNYAPPAPMLTEPIDLSKVPDDLILYIPDHPIYKGDIHNQLTNKQKAQLKPLQVDSKAWKDHVRQLKSMKESDLQIKKEASQREENAKLWNMSVNVINQHLILVAHLCTLQDLHGEKALLEQEILAIPLTSNTKRKKVDKLVDKIRKLSPSIDEILSLLPSLKGTPYYVLEEDRALELCPNKRPVNINRNLDLLLSPHAEKRVCIRDSLESRIDTSLTFIG
ncbi:hypothetical protein C1646_812620 [Rhizophagus diaphanus]|nr:hypothetical protein C1646_812620 [Rhizophagus diaphanus] [Rhizophagus sp. MUCL 43196]